MRYFLDTEFVEDGKTIMPISAALVREDGAHLYIEFPFDREKASAHDFVRENVLPHLRRPVGRKWEGYAALVWWERQDKSGKVTGHAGTFPEHVAKFLAEDPYPEFWAYFADYDWVLFCQRYGTMMDLPSHLPKFCMDLQQLWVMVGRPPKLPPPDSAHDALADARWNLELYAYLTAISR